MINKIKSFLDSDNKDWNEAAIWMLQINHNRIMYNNVMRNINAHHDTILYELKKYVKAKTINETHEKVEAMRRTEEIIVAKRKLDKNVSTNENRGKRPDHDELPDTIKALYLENFKLLAAMREIHLQLRMIAKSNPVCLDSEQYPLLVEIIKKDNQLHENWRKYDSFTFEGAAEEKMNEQIKEESIKATKMVAMLAGKYKKNPSEELKRKILAYAESISNPSEKIANIITEIKGK